MSIDPIVIEMMSAERGDLPAILALFDRSQEWLVEQGIPGQWGTEPFSQLDGIADRFGQRIDDGEFFLARIGDEIVGTMTVQRMPPSYSVAEWEQTPREALYIGGFTTDRRRVGQGIGAQMLDWAADRARAQGIGWLRLDCWAGNPALRAYYVRVGYSEVGRCHRGDWEGAMFEREI